LPARLPPAMLAWRARSPARGLNHHAHAPMVASARPVISRSLAGRQERSPSPPPTGTCGQSSGSLFVPSVAASASSSTTASQGMMYPTHSNSSMCMELSTSTSLTGCPTSFGRSSDNSLKSFSVSSVSAPSPPVPVRALAPHDCSASYTSACIRPLLGLPLADLSRRPLRELAANISSDCSPRDSVWKRYFEGRETDRLDVSARRMPEPRFCGLDGRSQGDVPGGHERALGTFSGTSFDAISAQESNSFSANLAQGPELVQPMRSWPGTPLIKTSSRQTSSHSGVLSLPSAEMNDDHPRSVDMPSPHEEAYREGRGTVTFETTDFFRGNSSAPWQGVDLRRSHPSRDHF